MSNLSSVHRGHQSLLSHSSITPFASRVDFGMMTEGSHPRYESELVAKLREKAHRAFIQVM